MTDDATRSHAAVCHVCGIRTKNADRTGEPLCPVHGGKPGWDDHARPDRAAIEVKVYPVEHRALRAAIDAVGSPPKLPDWYDDLANLWIRIEDSYGD